MPDMLENESDDAVLGTKPTVNLTTEDGNAFAILGRCHRAARDFGWTDRQWDQVKTEMMAGDYDHLLQTVMEHFHVE